jgi:hypothetical protein
MTVAAGRQGAVQTWEPGKCGGVHTGRWWLEGAGMCRHRKPAQTQKPWGEVAWKRGCVHKGRWGWEVGAWACMNGGVCAKVDTVGGWEVGACTGTQNGQVHSPGGSWADSAAKGKCHGLSDYARGD